MQHISFDYEYVCLVLTGQLMTRVSLFEWLLVGKSSHLLIDRRPCKFLMCANQTFKVRSGVVLYLQSRDCMKEGARAVVLVVKRLTHFEVNRINFERLTF